MPGRYLIYTPRINPDSFVFFFSRAASDRSFSIRDYSFEPVERRDASDFPPDVTDRTVLEWAREPGCHCIEDVDPRPVGDVDHWRKLIAKTNRLRLGKGLEIKSQVLETAGTDVWQFPMLDLEVLQHLPKARKTKDMKRMQSSPRSEDWVTWNVARLLDRHDHAVWWPTLLTAVSRQTIGPVDLPPPIRIVPWVRVSTPVAYEAASRERLAASDDPADSTRASHPDRVEGDSEIDLVIEGRDYLIYVEAKLDSDISLATTHDPARNQLVRNIDCVLEHCGDRRPVFWMAVRDRAAHRKYVQLIEEWRRDWSVLATQLPHRAPSEIQLIVSQIAIISWPELLEGIEPRPDELPVWEEIQRRIH